MVWLRLLGKSVRSIQPKAPAPGWAVGADMGHFFGGKAHGLDNVAFENLPRLEGWLEY
jgi:hypothetical protein